MNLPLLLAQDMPDTEVLATGNEQEILAWIIAGLLFALSALVIWHLKCMKDAKTERKNLYEKHQAALTVLHDKRDVDHKRTTRLALRSQKAMEIWAGITSEFEEDDEE